MDFTLSDELTMLRDMVRDFAKEKIAPFADKWDEEHYFPYEEALKPMGELGLFGTCIPEEYGGNDMGWLAAMIVTEEIARASSSLRVQINMQALGCAYTIYRYGTEEIGAQTGECGILRRFCNHGTECGLGCYGPEVHGSR
jgi:glutaryl-CoA dehydrogenase (non-decarboxylating)